MNIYWWFFKLPYNSLSVCSTLKNHQKCGKNEEKSCVQLAFNRLLTQDHHLQNPKPNFSKNLVCAYHNKLHIFFILAMVVWCKFFLLSSTIVDSNILFCHVIPVCRYFIYVATSTYYQSTPHCHASAPFQPAAGIIGCFICSLTILQRGQNCLLFNQQVIPEH